MTIEEIYTKNCKKSCDINRHLPTLKEYASKVEHITEFGVRRGISTSAFLAGEPKVLISYDIDGIKFKNYKTFKSLAKNVKFKFVIADVLKVVIDKTDLLFIDTRHTYKQLKKELKLHGSKVRKYIIFHDTITFGDRGEDNTTPGLVMAINEFLKENEHWQIEKIFKYNNGLTILRNYKNVKIKE